MIIYSQSNNNSTIPTVGMRNWIVPSGAIILYHAYLKDRKSPQQKDYTLRLYSIPSRNRNNSIYVAVAYFGGSLGGRQERNNQVKYVGHFESYSEINTLINEKRSKGYALMHVSKWTAREQILHNSVPLDYVGGGSIRQSEPAKPIKQINPSEVIRKWIEDAVPSEIVKKLKSPLSDAEKNECLNEQNKILLGKKVSDAIMSEELFESAISIPRDILSLLPLSAQAENKIEEVRRQMETFSKIRFIRKMD